MKPIALRRLLIFVALLSSCRAQSTPTLVSVGDVTPTPLSVDELHPELKNIPIYPESTPWMEGIPRVDRYSKDNQIYSYIAQISKFETLIEFYDDNMPLSGWEPLGTMDMSGADIGQGYVLLFAKGKTIATIDLIEWEDSSILVTISFTVDPLYVE